MTRQLELLFEPPKRRVVDPQRTEPAVWVASVVVLRERSFTPETVVREIRLRQGLNILWARPSAIENNRLYDGRLSGHTAGKTTFCRLIRYLLGEPRFATPRIQERIRESAQLRDGWVVGEVVVAGVRWVVGRPFALNVHPFAVRNRTIAEAIAEGGPFQDFLDALNAATIADLPVKTLPGSSRAIDWPLLLTWLTRDQEARFSGVDDFRASRSESDSPNPAAVDRAMVVRAVLDVASGSEAELQRLWEELWRAKETIEREAAIAAELALDSRERLAAKLKLPKENLESGPLFLQAAATAVQARRTALAKALTEAEGAAAAAADAEKAKDEAAEARGRAAARVELLQEGLDEARNGPVAARSVRKRESLAVEPPPAAPGRCNALLSEATERGCPLALAAPAAIDVDIMQVRRGAERLEAGKDDAQERTPDLQSKLVAASAMLAGAQQAAEETRASYLQLHTAHAGERERLAKEGAAIEEMGRLLQDVRRKEGNADRVDERKGERTARMQEISEQKAALRKTHGEALARLSRRFEGILQALLGDRVRGEVKVSREAVEPVVMADGERESAAMDTVKVLAFDLAALTLGIENHGHFPGFLLHDGPREADMDQAIYERLFLYAKEMEDAFPEGSGIGFQYIVTTTTPPPEKLQQAPWLLDPVLNAAVPEGRLFKMDL